MITPIIKWTIDIIFNDTENNNSIVTQDLVYAEAFGNLIDSDKEGYDNFIANLKKLMEDSDFMFDAVFDSDRTNSKSKYYQFIKFDDKEILAKVLVYVRVSNHRVGSKLIKNKSVSYKQRHNDFLTNNKPDEINKKYGITQDFKSIPVNIVFNGDNFISYEDALKYAKHLIDTTLSQY